MCKKDIYWPGKEWSFVNIENNRLLTNADTFIRQFSKRINSFIIVKDGYLVFEKYYNNYNRYKSAHICSITKSFTAALIGIAIDKGYIKSENDLIIDYFPEYNMKNHNYLLCEVKIRHLLTMSSGIVGKAGRNGFEPVYDRIIRSKDWIDNILKLPVQEDLINSYRYNSLNTHLLSIIIKRAVNMSVAEFANKFLFEPIGINRVEDIEIKPITFSATSFSVNTYKNNWTSDPFGYNIGNAGLSLTPLDLARFGYLYMNDGKWNNEQIISESWINKSLNDTVQSSGNMNYGYHWLNVDDKKGFYQSSGFGGQDICLFRDENIIVVFTSRDNNQIKAGTGPSDVLNKFIEPWIYGGNING